MVELPFSTWMVQGDGDEAFDEGAFIKDYAGSMEFPYPRSKKLSELLTAIDLGVYTIPQLIKDMGPYINQDADLVTVARGTPNLLIPEQS
jgi:hypothetical protein